MTHRPLLLIDVDGPLNPYAAPPSERLDGYTTHRLSGFRVWLNPSHGPALQALPYELAWATTREHDANTMIGPILGLPELPVIAWPDADTAPGRVYFKTPTIVQWAAGRPFAWIDDEICASDREYVAATHDGPALLHYVNPAKGLLPADFEALAAWAESLTVDGCESRASGRTPRT